MLLLAVKIGIGGSMAIYIAERLQLEYATSAGIITLLTLISTRWDTFRLSAQRLLTYGVSVCICLFAFWVTPSMWISYGLFLFLVVLLTEWLGWRGTLSANAVIGSHFLVTQDFSFRFVLNEFMLLVIGIIIAVLLNLIHINNAHENGIIRRMRKVEAAMKQVLWEVAEYLLQRETDHEVWEDLSELEAQLKEYIELSCEYHKNTFHSYQDYYIAYFEMRLQQCGALQNLRGEMVRMRSMPKQAEIVAKYILEITEYLTEMNDPQTQLRDLHKLLDDLRKEPLPISHEEFESRAELYHVLMDLEEFLLYKKRFVEEIDETQFRIYWQKEILEK